MKVLFPVTEFSGRIKRFAKGLSERGLDAAWIVSGTNRLYLTGFVASNGLLLVTAKGDAMFYTDFRYLEAARKVVAGIGLDALTKDLTMVSRLKERTGTLRRIGYEGSMDAKRFLDWHAALPGAAWEDVSDLLTAQRSIKSSRELAVIRAAVAENERIFAQHACPAIRLPGATEASVRRAVLIAMIEKGYEEAFSTIVAGGAMGSQCHHVPDETELGQGPVLVDMGVKLGGYCSDMTRCVAAVKPSARYRQIHAIVLKANRAAIRAIRPGKTCAEIDAVARGVIEKAGFGEQFGHGLGHGVGLDIHEAPSFASTCKTVLESGMVMTVEPGIYLPDELGVRLEDMIVVTQSGCDVLTRTPHWIDFA